MRVSPEQEMTEFMRHGVTQNDRSIDVAFLLQYQYRFMEQVGVAPSAVRLKRHAHRRLLHAMWPRGNSEVKMGWIGHLCAGTEGGLFRTILRALDPNDLDVSSPEYPPCFAFGIPQHPGSYLRIVKYRYAHHWRGLRYRLRAIGYG
jgi:hypothetical protein